MSGELIGGRYLVERKLGSGGAAEVLLSADTILHRQVAIKRLHGWLSADREARIRFQQEAQAFARLTHPHIVALFDVGEDNNRPYLVMEYLEGETLRKIIAAEGPFHPDDVAVVLEHIGEALDYAHRRGVVHRDIKPENVLVDRHGVVKVVDFGIAKVLEDATITQAGLAPGTAQYISPEQAQGHPVTPASDIYSLGVIAYEMLAGRPPFTGDSAVAVATQHVNEPPASPSDINPTAPRSASDIVLKALAKDPNERYSSAGDFAQAMLRWNAQPPTPTRPVVPTAADLGATVRIPTTDIAPPAAPIPFPPERVDPAAAAPDDAGDPPIGGLGRAGIGVAAVLGLLVAGAILWLLLDRESPGAPSPTATVRTLAVADATEEAEPTETQVPPEETATVLPEPRSIDVAALGLTGLPSDQAVQRLVTLGVNVAVRTVTAPEIPQDQVVSISPREVAPGDEVVVEVSMGNRAQIPLDLQGTSVDEAEATLEERGFTVDRRLGVSRSRIEEVLGPGVDFPFEDGDVVGIQPEDLVFGEWYPVGQSVSLVYYDAALDA